MSGLDTRDGARRLASRSSSTNCTAPVRCTLWAKHACTQRMRPSAWRRRRFRLPAPGAAPGNNSGAIRSWSSGCSSQCRSGRLCSNCAALQPSRASGCPSTATRVGSGASSKVKTTSGGQGMRPWFPGKFLLGKGTTRPHSYAGTRPLSLLTPGAGGFLCSARCTGFCSRPGCSPALVRAWHGLAWLGLHPAARQRSPRRAQVLGRLSSTGFGGSLPKKFKGQIGLWRLCSLRWQLSKKDGCEQSAAPVFQAPAFLPAAAGGAAFKALAQQGSDRARRAHARGSPWFFAAGFQWKRGEGCARRAETRHFGMRAPAPWRRAFPMDFQWQKYILK